MNRLEWILGVMLVVTAVLLVGKIGSSWPQADDSGPV